MLNPPKSLTAQQITDLSQKELSQILEFYTDDEKNTILQPLKDSNSILNEKILKNKKIIENERFLNILFLKKLWKCLKKEEKVEAAEFFKSIYDSIINE